MKALVTGATGFIGSHLVQRLIQDGYAVRALARQSSDTVGLESLGVEVVRGDLLDPALMEKAARGCEQLYHLAVPRARTSLPKRTYHEVNIAGARNVARAAQMAGIQRLVFAGSAVASRTNSPALIDESSSYDPDSAYRETKLAGEQELLSLHTSASLPIVVARLPRVLGPRCMAWVGLFQAIAARRFRLIGSGTNWIHVGPVPDIVDGLRRCAETAAIEGECYVLAGKEPVRVKDLMAMIAGELNVDLRRARLPVGPYRAFHSFAAFTYKRLGLEFPRSHRYEIFFTDRRFDISKAKGQLGYDPQMSVRECIRETARWYQEKGLI